MAKPIGATKLTWLKIKKRTSQGLNRPGMCAVIIALIYMGYIK